MHYKSRPGHSLAVRRPPSRWPSFPQLCTNASFGYTALGEDNENKIAKNKDIYPPDGYFGAILEFYFTLCT